MTAAALCAGLPAMAQAQTETLLVNPVIPQEYDRDRNVSVSERPRPDYDPLGIRAGGFLVFPRIEVGIGYSDNIYLSEFDRVSAPFGEVTGGVRANSDWSRHQLSASLSGTVRRYVDEPDRNEEPWRAALLGRADIGSSSSVTGEFQAARIFETPFTGAIDQSAISLSSYDTVLLGVRGQHSMGRSRLTLGYTRSEFDFQPIRAPDGLRLNQSNRNRDVDAVAGQAEYALSPTSSVYGQVSYGHTDYEEPLGVGFSNRNSDGYRVLAGLSFDLPAQVRGNLAAGYTHRDFTSDRFRDVGGLSVEARLEWFYSQLTTVTFGARRVIEDSSLGDVSAFFDNRVSALVDHELLTNLILGATAEYAHQDYIDSDRSNDVYRIGANARYFVSRSLTANFRMSYSRRERDGLNNTGQLDEFRGVFSVAFHR